MLRKILNRLHGLRSSSPAWSLQGFDTFAGEYYSLGGRYSAEQAVRRAARKELRRLEKAQPSSQSGGQGPDGIQDRIFIVRPDKSMYRYEPEA